MTSVKEDARQHPVTAEEAGQRIDNFLLRVLKQVPKSHVYKILRGGQVRVNKGRVKADYRLLEGDLVRLPPIWRDLGTPKIALPRPGLEARILFEDESLLVLDKPTGLAVHGGSGVSQGVIETLRANRPDAAFLELVHRLDRETSGCLLIAKKRSALRSLHEQLREGSMDKHYLLLVKGAWRGGVRNIQVALQKNTLRSGERLVQVSEAGKAANTRFVPVQVFAEATLLRAELDTGRTHQIRVHAQSIGQPVAGDDKYGDPAFNQRLRELGLKRLFLHAAELNFMHPRLGERMTISAALPVELQAVLARLSSESPGNHAANQCSPGGMK